MYIKVLFLLCSVNFVLSTEGEPCVKDGFVGVCVNLRQCQSAINDIKNRKNPQICSFVQATPIVCCLDAKVEPQRPTPAPTQKPIATTTTRRPSSSTTEYTPPVNDYVNVDPEGQCEPIPPKLTSPKTGQKAWDKCLEYQEQLIFPCERGVDLTGQLSRGAHCHHNADGLIVGGTDAAAHEFPHMVMIGYGSRSETPQWLCGGALISDRYVLTAGHCISGTAETGPVTHVLIGALTREETANSSKVYQVQRSIKHPEYKSPVKYHDIALLELDKPVNLDQFTVPACLHVGDAVADNIASATGWGLTEYKGGVSEVLQKVGLTKFTTEECSATFKKHRLMNRGVDTTTQICYGDKRMSKDTCQGDSGGPLQIKSQKMSCMYVIVGVTSFGRACGFVGQPGIYTRVAPYVSWIESIVWP